jgi:hypothetical protein
LGITWFESPFYVKQIKSVNFLTVRNELFCAQSLQWPRDQPDGKGLSGEVGKGNSEGKGNKKLTSEHKRLKNEMTSFVEVNFNGW